MKAYKSLKMNSVFKYINKNKGICVIILLFLIIMLVILHKYKIVWWDSAVYIGMGKYIFSYGKAGLWEESRPLILPFMLGLGWKLGFDVVIFGRILSVIFSVLIIIITYIIGTKLFSNRAGLIAALFTALSFNFVFFSANILTEISSALFVLLAFYFFIKHRFFLMGMFSGISVMTRFFQIFVLIGLWLVFIVYNYKKTNFAKKLFYSILGISLIITPYFLLNIYLYNDVLLPFKVQAHLTKTTGWIHYKEFGFYFEELFEENYLLVLLLISPVFYKNNYKFSALLIMSMIYIIVFSFAKHKETRFMFTALPFLYLLLAYCLEQTYAKIRNRTLSKRFFYVIIIFFMYLTFIKLNDVFSYQRQDEELLYFQNYLKENYGKIWITNPLYALHYDGKIEGLLYFYSSKNLIRFLEDNKGDVDIVLYNSCDMECPPIKLDYLCPRSRSVLNNKLFALKVVYERDIDSCKYKIYKRAISEA